MTTTTQRIGLYDDIQTIMVKMCEGNPDAASVIIEIIKRNKDIDPDDAMGGFGPLLSLDMAGIYGPSIWVLYKDTCGQDLIKMLAVLRGYQLGFITQEQLNVAADRNGARGQNVVDVEATLTKVKQELPDFGKGVVV